MPDQIQLEIRDQGIKELLRRLQGRTADLRPAMGAVSQTMLHAVEENFAQQGRPRWPRLKTSTQRARAEKGHWPGKILQRSGQLAASITARHSATEAAVGTNKRYAAIHQFGGTIPAHTVRPRFAKALKIPTKNGYIYRRKARIPQVTIPPRPFLHLTPEDLEEIRHDILHYLMK